MPIDLSTLITKEDKFATLQENKINELSRACRDSIVSGFDSNALGDIHHYPAQPEDQTNLLGRVIQAQMNSSDSGWTVTFACQDASGNWSKPSHTASQMIQVGVASAQDVENKTNQYTALVGQVMSAKTDVDVNKIVWVYPPKE